MIKGLGASPGIAIGKVFILKEEEIIVEKNNISNVVNEINKFNQGLKKVAEQLSELKNKVEKKLGKEKAEIFEAHELILNDPDFIEAVKGKIEDEKVNAEFAVDETVKSFREIFMSMDNEYMKERAVDIVDVGTRLLKTLTNNNSASIADVDEECIVVANDLTPSDTAQMEKEFVLGFVTNIGGKTSHSAIIAKTLELPAVVGTKDVTSNVKNGDLLIIDGETGTVIVNPEDRLVKEYTSKQEEYLKNKNELLKYINMTVKTKDNRKIEVATNIGNIGDANKAVKYGADGVGLFRTEFLYMDRDKLPTEEDQFQVYKDIVEVMNDKTVIIRTLDIGGDKKLSYLKIDKEMNPFLGYRAIRLCLDRKDIFKIQLRAILRASIYGKIKIMFPMISNLVELRQAKAVLEDVKKELISEGVKFDSDIKVGIMIEIPSAAIMSDILAEEVDFFSIGTNDLIQYTTAVDRMNEKVSYLYDAFNPAVLRLIKLVIDNAHKNGKKVGMCGETAGDPALIPIYLGFGLDEFSMSTASILKAKKQISELSYEECTKLSSKILKMKTSDEIKEQISK